MFLVTSMMLWPTLNSAYIPESDNIACSSMQLSNHTHSEAMHNVSAHQLPQYYQPQQLPSKIWTALVMWYISHKLTHIKILQNFWFFQVFSNLLIQSLNNGYNQIFKQISFTHFNVSQQILFEMNLPLRK